MELETSIDNYLKLHISDLKTSEQSACKNFWSLNLSGKQQCFKFVWIQGIVDGIMDDSFFIKDSTGTCKITATNAVHSSNNISFSKGDYCLVLGQLQQMGNMPEVSAMKITSMCKNDVLQKMWDLEVIELKHLISGTALPSLNVCKSIVKSLDTDVF